MEQFKFNCSEVSATGRWSSKHSTDCMQPLPTLQYQDLLRQCASILRWDCSCTLYMAHSLCMGVVPAEEGTLAGHAEAVASTVWVPLYVCVFGLQGRVNFIHVEQHRAGLCVDGRGRRSTGPTGDRLDQARP